MADLHYDHPRLAALYDHDSGWSEDRDFYLNLATKSPQHILDLGCGTGLICNAYAARAHKVTGLDPSATMLDIARKSSFGKSIKWVEAFSQNFKLNQKFDLIIMTGHAFQVLLTDADVISMFASVKRRLKPTGEFVFESRNPEINWQSQWDHNYTLDIKNQKIHVEGKILSFANETMVFEHEYIFEDERLTSKSELRFMSKDNITDCAAQAGLSVKSLIGSWDGSAYSAATSQEMIFTLHAK